MFQTTLSSITLTLILAATSSAEVSTKDERDLDQSGAMSVAELQKQPITFELDIPYANDTNPRHRLDLYLPKQRKSDKLQVIVFFHGGGWMEGDKSDGAGTANALSPDRTLCRRLGRIPFIGRGPVARSDLRLQSGDSLGTGERFEIRARRRPHWRVGPECRRSPRVDVGRDRRCSGTRG